MKNNKYIIIFIVTFLGSIIFSSCQKEVDFLPSKKPYQKLEIIENPVFPDDQIRGRFHNIMEEGFNFYEFAASQTFMDYAESASVAFRRLMERTGEFVYTGCCTWDEFLLGLEDAHNRFIARLHAGEESYAGYFLEKSPYLQRELFNLVDYIILNEYSGINGFCYTVNSAASLGDTPRYYKLLRSSATRINKMNEAELIHFIHPITEAYMEELQETTQIPNDAFYNTPAFNEKNDFARDHIFPAFRNIEERGESFSYDIINAMMEEMGISDWDRYERQMIVVSPYYETLPINLKVEQTVVCTMAIDGPVENIDVKELFWWWMNHLMMSGADQDKIERACWDYISVS